MTCSGTHDPGACPCGIPHFPVVICNQANQPQILFRIGDYLAFRDRLLRPLPKRLNLLPSRLEKLLRSLLSMPNRKPGARPRPATKRSGVF